MKKKILPILIATFIISLINTGLLAFLIFNQGDFEFKQKPVVISRDYDKGQTMEKALAAGKPIIVWFYTDWCGYCQKLAPMFKKLTQDKQIKKNYAVAYVNAENPANEVYTKEYNVEGYPTVYVVNSGKRELISNLELFSNNAVESLKVKLLESLK